MWNLPLSITYCGPKLEVFILQSSEDLVSDVYDVLLLEGDFLSAYLSIENILSTRLPQNK